MRTFWGIVCDTLAYLTGSFGSNPDRRAAFDDFGVATDMSSEQAGAGFETWEEYQRSGKQATVRLKSSFSEMTFFKNQI